MSDKNNSKNTNYEKEYSEDSFWEKVKNFAKNAGETVIEKALTLYYVAQDNDTPTWAKTTVYAALGYFISPIDAIPDVVPVAGFSDDLGVLAIAIATVAAHIKDKHTQKAKETLKQWFS